VTICVDRAAKRGAERVACAVLFEVLMRLHALLFAGFAFAVSACGGVDEHETDDPSLYDVDAQALCSYSSNGDVISNASDCATGIVIFGSVKSLIETVGDVDWFSFVTDSDGLRHVYSVGAAVPSSQARASCALYASDRTTLLASSATCNISYASSLASRTLYLKVWHQSTATYAASVSEDSACNCDVLPEGGELE
jgi:hypothetical protein